MDLIDESKADEYLEKTGCLSRSNGSARFLHSPEKKVSRLLSGVQIGHVAFNPIRAELERRRPEFIGCVRRAKRSRIPIISLHGRALVQTQSRKMPNQLPEPTPTSVTPPADAEVASAAVMAHL